MSFEIMTFFLRFFEIMMKQSKKGEKEKERAIHRS